MRKAFLLVLISICFLFFLWMIVSIYFMVFVNNGHRELKGNDYLLFKETPVWELAKSIRDGDKDKIIRLIKKEPEMINYQEPKYGNTLLMMTVMNQQLMQFHLLLDNHADVDIHNTYDGSSAIIESVRYKWFDIQFTEQLVARGASVNDIQTGGKSEWSKIRESVLMSAVSSGKMEFVQFLVDQGSDVNYINENCESALSKAIMTNKHKIGYYLLLNGADFNRPLYYRPDLSIPSDLLNPDDKGEPVYLANALREDFFEFHSENYKYKMLIVEFLQKHGINYWEIPIPDYIKERIKKEHPITWKIILKKY